MVQGEKQSPPNNRSKTMQIILTEFEASEILLPLCNFDADELGEIETDHNGITAHMNDDREIKLELVSSGSKLYAVQIDE